MVQKMPVLKSIIMIALIYSSVASQTINITGTVVDSSNSQGISGASVKLVEIPSITTTTSSTGAFTLSGTPTSAEMRSIPLFASDMISITGNRLMILVAGNTHSIVVDVFSMNGSRVYHAEARSQANEAIEFSNLWKTAGMYHIRIKTGNRTQVIQIPASFSISEMIQTQSSANVRELGKITAAYTVEISKTGYFTRQLIAANETTALGTIKLLANNAAPVRYTPNRVLSPMDATIVQRMKDIAARGSGLRKAVFMKVGDSNSILSYQGFVNCFNGHLDTNESISYQNPWRIKLDGRDSLAPTIQYFRSIIFADSSTSYGRGSLSTVVGTASGAPLYGSQPTLIQEYNYTKPQFAIVMFGSNDIQGSLPTNIEPHEAGMRAIADSLIARGVIPIFTTMPQRDDQISYTNQVPSFTAVQRAIAQGRQFPLIDLNLAAWPLTGHGLGANGGDGVHLATKGSFESCEFCTSKGDLEFGMTTRNLITMQMLHRIKKSFIDNGPAPDASVPRLQGAGSSSDPFIIDTITFTDMRDVRTSPNNSLGPYSCAGAQTAPGKEFIYKLILTNTKSIRILVLDAQAHAVSVALLSGLSASQCLKSAPRMIEKTLTAGTYYIAVHGNSAGVGAEYVLAVTGCVSGDAACAQ